MYAKQSEPKGVRCQIDILPSRSRPHCGLSRITIITNLIRELADATPWSLAVVTCSVEKPTREVSWLCDVVSRDSSTCQLMSF
jgi:hypothetical protein